MCVCVCVCVCVCAQRAMDCYEHAVALLDTSEKGWKIVYANSSWAKQTGMRQAGWQC